MSSNATIPRPRIGDPLSPEHFRYIAELAIAMAVFWYFVWLGGQNSVNNKPVNSWSVPRYLCARDGGAARAVETGGNPLGGQPANYVVTCRDGVFMDGTW